MQHIDHTPRTSLPCPDWCTLPAGHRFDSIDKAGAVIRYHVRVLDEIPVAARSRETIVGWMNGGAVVQVAAEETAAGDLGPVMTGGPVVVNIFGIEEGDNLTGPEVRALASALLNAADEWDRIAGDLS